MSNAKRDENFVPTALGDDGSGNTVPLTVDTATSRLLIDITITDDTSPGSLSISRDGNFVPVAIGVTDDANETLTPLIVKTSNGYLFADVTIE